MKKSIQLISVLCLFALLLCSCGSSGDVGQGAGYSGGSTASGSTAGGSTAGNGATGDGSSAAPPDDTADLSTGGVVPTVDPNLTDPSSRSIYYPFAERGTVDGYIGPLFRGDDRIYCINYNKLRSIPVGGDATQVQIDLTFADNARNPAQIQVTCGWVYLEYTGNSDTYTGETRWLWRTRLGEEFNPIQLTKDVSAGEGYNTFVVRGSSLYYTRRKAERKSASEYIFQSELVRKDMDTGEDKVLLTFPSDRKDHCLNINAYTDSSAMLIDYATRQIYFYEFESGELFPSEFTGDLTNSLYASFVVEGDAYYNVSQGGNKLRLTKYSPENSYLPAEELSLDLPSFSMIGAYHRVGKFTMIDGTLYLSSNYYDAFCRCTADGFEEISKDSIVFPFYCEDGYIYYVNYNGQSSSLTCCKVRPDGTGWEDLGMWLH